MSEQRQRAQIEVQVSIADSHLGQIGSVVARLEAAGLRVEQRLDAIGVLTGRVAPGHLDNLKQIPGVEGVEASRTVGIPPGEQGG